MRRFWFLLLVITTIVVIALPAGAKKPPKPTPSAPVAVSLEGNPMWVHEVGDDILYSVTVQNKTRTEVTVHIVHPEGTTPVTVQAGNAETVDNLFSHEVGAPDIDDCLDDGICDLLANVTVQYPNGDVIAVVETSTLVDPVDECTLTADDGTAFVKSGLCIWKPSPGHWTLSAVPEPVPTRPTNLMMTMRDGVPGNWCTLPDDGGGGVIQERWLKTSTSIDLDVYLPGGDGQCLMGGAGVCTDDDCYFAVGNPESFYLYTTFDGFITVSNTD